MSAPVTILVPLFHHRWSVPTLAALSTAGGGTKFITLLNRLQISRPSLKRTLEYLVDDGWITPNPGYGHPMRPEYVLTDAGRALGPHCVRLMRLLRRLDLEDAALRKWPLSIAATIGRGTHRFNDIRESLPGITARALTLALKSLQDAALVERCVYDDSPPVVEYTLKPRARAVTEAVNQLARAAARAA